MDQKESYLKKKKIVYSIFILSMMPGLITIVIMIYSGKFLSEDINFSSLDIPFTFAYLGAIILFSYRRIGLKNGFEELNEYEENRKQALRSNKVAIGFMISMMIRSLFSLFYNML